MNRVLFVIALIASHCSYSQSSESSLVVNTGASWLDAGDMWAGNFGVSFFKQIGQSRLAWGISIEGIYGDVMDAGLLGENVTVITSRGNSFYYSRDNPVWEEGFWQSEASTYKQFAIGIGPSFRYTPLQWKGHKIHLSADVLLRFNDQQFVTYSEPGYTIDGYQVQIVVPLLWQFWDIAPSFGVSYEYQLESGYGFGLFARYRESLDPGYLYGHFGASFSLNL